MEDLNFIPVGRFILIDLGVSEVSKSGIIMPEGSYANIADSIKPEYAYEVVAAGPDADIKVGTFIYFAPYAAASPINLGGKFYSLHVIEDIGGFAPKGFSKEVWERDREERASKLKAERKKRMEEERLTSIREMSAT